MSDLARPRLVMRLAGGLGNQLFQYAAGRSAADAIGATLVLDASSFRRDPLGRSYALGRFPIDAERSDLSGLRRRVVETPGLWRFARATGWVPRIGGVRYLHDRLRGFDARLLEPAPETIAIGYWQDERHVLPARTRLLRELDPSRAFDDATRSLGEELADPGAVAMHVRRGDFAAAGSSHGTCDGRHYRAALRALAEGGPIRRLHLFSDDPAAAKALAEAIAEGTPWRVESAARRPEDEELWLMSRCARLAIANSSYSWWAAWLADRGGERAGTLIACPDRWYRPSAGPIPHPAPARWRRIDSHD